MDIQKKLEMQKLQVRKAMHEGIDVTQTMMLNWPPSNGCLQLVYIAGQRSQVWELLLTYHIADILGTLTIWTNIVDHC